MALAVTLSGCSPVKASETDAETTLKITAQPTTTTSEPDNYTAFTQLLARRQALSDRVDRISRTLRVANAPLCTVTRADAGLFSHRLEDYPPTVRPLALHFMDLEAEGRFVRSVIPGSPADRAQVNAGDHILSGWPMRADAPLVTQRGVVAMTPQTACVAPAFVIDSPVPNAATDGREIELSSTLVEQAGDDAALALIIAHEMAHVLRGHTPDRLRGRGARWAAELQADADALILMRNAGYDVANTVAGWEAGVETHRESQAMSMTHPPLDLRLRNLEQALDRLESGPKGFRALPDEGVD